MNVKYFVCATLCEHSGQRMSLRRSDSGDLEGGVTDPLVFGLKGSFCIAEEVNGCDFVTVDAALARRKL
jgi:hypothetical protein